MPTRHPRRTTQQATVHRATALVAGLAALTLTSTAVAAHAAQSGYNEQVALVDGTDEQPKFESWTSSTAQTASQDGRYVVFATEAPLVAEDGNQTSDVYLRDLTAGATVLVSVRNGEPGNDISTEPTISADGRFVAFTTWADNLTAKDRNGHTLDVVVKDLESERLVLASVTSAEDQLRRNSFSPVLSDDGRSVSFQSFAALGPRDDDKREDVYVRDLEAGVTRQGSLLPGADRDVKRSVLNGDLSGDGSLVTFGNDNNLWVRNLLTGETTRFWHEPDSPPCQPFPMGSAGRPAISGNGKFAAFASCALDLPGENGHATDVYRISLVTGRIVRVHPQGDGNSFLPSLSYSGRYVGFGTEAGDLVAGDTPLRSAMVADVRDRTVTRASSTPSGDEGNNESAGNDVAISPDGRTLVYVSFADDLVPGDVHDLPEVFVWHAEPSGSEG